MKYDVNYFIKKFEAIPEDNFISNDWEDAYRGHCAGGHCGLNGNNCDEGTKEAISLAKVLSPLKVTNNKIVGFDTGYFWWKIPAINDGSTKEYQQPTPKQRILAALYDIKKMQQPEEQLGKTKQVIKYVSVPSSITEQTKELIMQ